MIIICCILNVENLLHMQYYKVANLQHLMGAEYYTSLFPADCVAILSYYEAVLIIINQVGGWMVGPDDACRL